MSYIRINRDYPAPHGLNIYGNGEHIGDSFATLSSTGEVIHWTLLCWKNMPRANRHDIYRFYTEDELLIWIQMVWNEHLKTHRRLLV